MSNPERPIRDYLKELQWLWSAGRVLDKDARQSFIDNPSDPEVYEKLQKQSKLTTVIQKCLRCFLTSANESGLDLPITRKLAMRIDIGDNLEELESHAIDAFAEIELMIEPPWIRVQLADLKVDKSTISRHLRNREIDYIKAAEDTGYYLIRQDKLHLYLTPAMIRSYTG